MTGESYMEKNRNGKIVIKKFTKARFYLTATLIVFCITGLYTMFTIDTGDINIGNALREFIKNLQEMFLGARLSDRYSFLEIFQSLGVSLSLAMMSTMIGGFIAAENLSGGKISGIIRITVSFIRSIPTILWVMVFSVVANIGVEAAVIGISFHTVAFLVKAYSESIEELDRETIEALKASGASWWQIIFQAVIPSSMASILSWTFVRFEMNFTNAVVVGAASGAGGIGYEMFMAGTMYHDLKEVGVFAYMILFTAVILEAVSYGLKKKYINRK